MKGLHIANVTTLKSEINAVIMKRNLTTVCSIVFVIPSDGVCYEQSYIVQYFSRQPSGPGWRFVSARGSKFVIANGLSSSWMRWYY